MTDSAIVVGNVGTVSARGPKYETYGVMQHAVQAWADVVNRNGGIAGRSIRVEVGDDANDPAKHLDLVKEMVERQHVVAFCGMPAVDTQGASVEYLEAEGIPVVGGALGNSVWGTSPVLFPQGIGATQKARALMHVVATTGKTRFAFLGIPISARPLLMNLFKGGLAAEAGIEAVFDAEIQPDATDYTEVGRAAQNAGVEILTMAAGFETQAKVMESFARIGFNPVYVMTGTGTHSDVLRLVGEPLEGAIGFSRVVPWMADEPADLDVWREAMEANGIEIGQNALLGWASGRILEEALRRIDDEVTPTTIADALRALAGQDLDGLVGPLGFASSPDEPNPGSSVLWTVVASGGEWVPGERVELPAPAWAR